MRGFLIEGSVPLGISDPELEVLRARLLVANDLISRLCIPWMPHDAESQIVELELLLELPDKRSKLQKKFTFAFDHLEYTNAFDHLEYTN